MKPVDAFLHSVRDAFHPSDEGAGWTWVALGACVALAITWTLFKRMRRREGARREFVKFLANRHVSPAQVILIGKLAAGAAVDRQTLVTHIDAFERATALELAKHPAAAAASGDEGIFGQISALRQALGFGGVAGHFALLTTRELGAGQIVEVAGTTATVSEVNEAHVSVIAAADAPLPLGATGVKVRVTWAHGQEARYEARCALLARRRGEGGQQVILAHDEHPTRIQLRRSVRVTVRGPVHLNPLGGPPIAAVRAEVRPDVGADCARPVGGAAPPVGPSASGAPERPHDGDAAGAKGDNGSLLDISVGGAALDTTIHVAVGALVQVSFDLDGASYRDLLALVLECSARPRGTHHMRLEFRNLDPTEESHLAASVARFSAKPFAQQQG